VRKKDVLIIGAGGVAHVAAHKVAQNNEVLGDLCIASRTLAKCDRIIESIKRKGSMKNPRQRIYSRQIDAMDVPALIQLIEETKSDIVINLGQSFVNMSVLEACIQTGTAYLDTAIHEEQDKVCEDPPWYGNHEWKRKDRCREKGITAILGIGFDPGVVNAWCAHAAKNHFDIIDTIDIMDVNAGSHGKYFATNFDPEINFREFKKVWSWIDRKWVERKVHSVKMVHEFPVVGRQTMYLTGHDEIHSLSKNLDVGSIRFWMGFSNQYINVFTVLTKLGLTSNLPIRTAEGLDVVPLKVLKALLPDPSSLAPNYTGKTCIGSLIKGKKEGGDFELFMYNICDHADCYREVEAQAISYTAGVPPVTAAILIAKGVWDVKTMVNVEELDPDPFIELLATMGLPSEMHLAPAVPILDQNA
jgi:saccharopine dehydrogenase-like NADP-dependent oxidoreductase